MREQPRPSRSPLPVAPPISDSAQATPSPDRPTAQPSTADPRALSRTLAELERTLREMFDAHVALAGLLDAKKQALLNADNPALTDLLRRENQQVQLIAELEKARTATTAQLTLLVEPNAPQPRRLTELAQRLPEPARGRLLVLREQLRERMKAVRDRARVTQHATEHIGRHMHGLVQTITALSSGNTTYQRNGQRPSPRAAVSTFNLSA